MALYHPSRYVILGVTCLLSLSVTSCRKHLFEDLPGQQSAKTDIHDLNIPDGFDYKTTQSCEVDILLRDNQGNPLNNAVIFLHTQREQDGTLLSSGITGVDGRFHTRLKLPQNQMSIWLNVHCAGIPEWIELQAGPYVHYEAGGRWNRKHQIPLNPNEYRVGSSGFVFLGTWDNRGVPAYLTSTPYYPPAVLIQAINASLQDGMHVANHHPQYLQLQGQDAIILQQSGEVFLSFLHEGNLMQNAVGFYTFDPGVPPASPGDIDSLFILFPNFSFDGSGGGLITGDRISLGHFHAGTAIGFFMVVNGWNGSTVTQGDYMVFTHRSCNPEADPALKQHTVMLYDPVTSAVVIGFEEMRRDFAGCDHDFNDAIAVVEVVPSGAVNASQLAVLDPGQADRDGDGVTDILDHYPDDAQRAFNHYYPTDLKMATLAFEDLWPSTGDYDYNDLVLRYNLNMITNANNMVTAMEIRWQIKAVGAGYFNGFGIELPLPYHLVASISGQQINGNIVSLNPNGTEAGQTNAVVIFFENAYDIVQRLLPYFINVEQGAPFVPTDTLLLTIEFAQPQSLSNLSNPPFNPFIFINGDRGRELHLPGHPPTPLADYSYFNTSHDDTDPATGRYYVTASNLCWAIDIPADFDHPLLKSMITEAYLHFGEWAESNGAVYNDWYEDKPGYRNPRHIY